MAILTKLVSERTDLTEADQNRILAVTSEWALVADLAMSDLVLWLPTWNDGGLVAGALVRPTTAPTNVPDDIVATFAPRGRFPDLDAALAFGSGALRVVTVRGFSAFWRSASALAASAACALASFAASASCAR